MPKIYNSTIIESINEKRFYILDSPIALPSIYLHDFTDVSYPLDMPFIDVKEDYWNEICKYCSRLLSAPDYGELISHYFKNEQPWLWNISLNLSRPSKSLNDSKYWHFDYGDSKQLHFMIYFSDVSSASGPFTFLPYEDSSKIKRSSFWIERLTDEDLHEFDCSIERSIQAIGSRGKICISDPGALLHQGARCSEDRLVLFISLSTSTPMSKLDSRHFTNNQRKDLYEAYLACNGKILSEQFFRF